MNQTEIQTARLDNGLMILVEPLPDVRSAAFSWWIPAGSAHEPPACNGAAAVLCDWMFRGAGDRDHQELSTAIDSLGVQSQESVTASHLIMQGACLGENLGESLKLYADLLLRPRFEEHEFEPTMLGVEQSLQALEDEPRQKVMVELTRNCYPRPWNRPPEGTLAELPNITPDVIRRQFAQCVRPDQAILGIAGHVDFREVLESVQALFGEWRPTGELPQIVTQPVASSTVHLPQESTQTQIGVAYPSVPYRDADYYAAWAASNILSGGMSCRLMTEVREKRGLCYSIYASLAGLQEAGFMLCYAGTTNERAAETLEVMLQVLRGLGEGVSEAELARCRARAKSALIMSQESTGARASSLARDWSHLGRVVTLQEVRQRIDALTPADIVDYVRRYPADDVSLVTIGPEPLTK